MAACGRCVHHMEITVNGNTLHACDTGRQFGRRCEQYKIIKPKGTP